VEDVIEADVHDDATLDRLLLGIDAVINLVGILHSRPGKPYGPDFARAHVDLPRRIVAACAARGAHRYLHMSALGAATDAPSMYLRSKADGETAAFSSPAVHTTVFRPSVVFGDGDRFLNLFASLERFLPVVPLAGADVKFQPVYVEDVAMAFVNALDNERTIGHTYELAGPRVYTLRELVKLAGAYTGHPRPVIGLPDSLARIQAALMEHMPGEPMMTRDNLDSMKVDNVASGPIDAELGITLTELEAVAPYYLTGKKPHGGVETVHIGPRR
jgi:NADH dehydrogenase